MSKTLNLIKANASNPKVWLVAGITVAGIIVVAETRRRRKKAMIIKREDFGAFMERFELIPFPQPPPPAAKLPLSGLTFAIKDIFDVKGHATGFGNPDWQRTHEVADKTAVVVTALLKNGAKCVGKTVMDELAFGITGENKHYGTPTNPNMPSNVPGGSSSGSAVAVAAELVDFALGTDTIGCVRVPASFCGVLGFRPSHGAVSTIGVLPNSQSLDAIGWFARDPSILHRVGNVLLQLKAVEPRRGRHLVFADDLFQLSKVPKQKTVHVISKAVEKLSGYQLPKHVNFCLFIASNVPSLKGFCQHSTNLQNGISALQALSSAMVSLQRYEFKTNHEEWLKDVKPRLGPEVSRCVLAAINNTYENVKSLYKVRTEMRAAMQSLLKGNAAFKGKQWNKAVNYYTEAIKLNGTNATYYNNRAAAYLELGCFQQAEEDCNKAISFDKKNVKAYLRRGTARDSLLCYKEALEDFKHALVLEPQNKVANLAEKRLRKLVS
ncbi:outer envelope protein 64, mitochondrial-like isoform X2 [Gossypium arboreum]|uniref:outer envelope protein 64, mitochondrial-like isoform X2 n=1 Tax=Gossypium arboreum TaxID=29729 RepID=UPI0022F18176|nr:outer envelope protein 64, mitochondrial-like isoform X2 [Gossypium arboreum]